MEPVVVKEPERGQYTLYVDGVEKGYLAYVDLGAAVDLPHTVVNASLRGSGLGGLLVQKALDDIKDNSTARVIPTCPFIAKWLLKNPSYQTLTKR